MIYIKIVIINKIIKNTTTTTTTSIKLTMGRKKIEIKRIDEERIRRVTFKKRRIGLLKKAI